MKRIYKIAGSILLSAGLVGVVALHLGSESAGFVGIGMVVGAIQVIFLATIIKE